MHRGQSCGFAITFRFSAYSYFSPDVAVTKRGPFARDPGPGGPVTVIFGAAKGQTSMRRAGSVSV